MQQYLTTADKAAEIGVSETTLRRRAAAGEVPGAIRLWADGPWRFPASPTNDSAPRGGEHSRGVSADSGIRVLADITSTWTPSVGATLSQDAMRVVGALSQLTSARPARAAVVMASPLLAIASRHAANRDGCCAFCGWQHPCPDYRDAVAGLERAAAIVVDGAA